MTSQTRKIVRRKRKASLDGGRYKLQTYLETADRELVERALEILEEGSMSGFSARATIKEAKRVIAEYEARNDKKPHR